MSDKDKNMLTIELINAEEIMLEEIANRGLYQKNIASTYGLSILYGVDVDYAKVNQAIIDRWSVSGLNRIKTMAWKMIEKKD